MKKGIIQQSLSGFYDVFADDKIYRTRARGNFRQRKIKPVVGDYVEFSAENQQEGYLLKILPRRNQLVRPPVANVDMAVVVTSAKEPAFSANLLDRQLIALEAQKITPLIYFSKTDLLTAEEYQRLLPTVEGYKKIGYQVYADYDPFNPQQLAAVMKKLTGNVVTMMGQTGAGKSTLLNHLAPQLKLATGEISQALQRGRHTTRKVSLLDVNGALIADTPGFSSYETFDMTVNDLPLLFPEMVELSANCKFRGCLHLKEPQCAVKEAVNNGIIMKSRYDDYVQFHELIANQKPNYKK
ncbi:ribosome small subunit-dependent GTPase A [Limosilactobacillus sp. RRLNB_1_1]|uniref:Small ribosomal subunit biogenesis GTPase RsgA n=1 Tax=Limosilactobacillus albertensis TaxID=2759752 RepID=A0A7W3TSX1_9LACO|nr:ribosome small subunit-dependent GTPase A [Limosilactobacillus albertensis]MBB1070249.1 ribosome small subunit-dependent GTPase A [Limosilactobacillus albertensis]MBB1124483.1 ribosome small subunit-dependent GTPase A [Limosilactobacillus albertensis]MCD7119152.1 ribosome small subunit-dependent GTPase A [Limosilactobacillus albertensis]MCD7123016.1 ribosome small subunit-dependent GTPase A [Limosilactobacillus albertensis]MCD7129360.1 ribosome small subunit-dependent GTPase A [Limosilactob